MAGQQEYEEQRNEVIEMVPVKQDFGVIDFKIENKDLVLVNPETVIASIKEAFDPVLMLSVLDLNIKSHYEFVEDGIRTYRKSRLALDSKRKDIGKLAKAHVDKTNAEGNRLRDLLSSEKAEEQISKFKKDFDTAKEIAKREEKAKDEKRVDDITDKIADIKALVSAHISSESKTLKTVIDKLNNDNITTLWAMEFEDKAKVAFIETANKLDELYKMKLKSEQAEAKALQIEKNNALREEKDRLAREAETARVAAENKAERKRLDDERAGFKAEQAKLKAGQKKLEDDKAKAAKKDEDDKIEAKRVESVRVDRIKGGIQLINSFSNVLVASRGSEEIGSTIQRLKNLVYPAIWADEFIKEANIATTTVMGELETLLDEAKEIERVAAEKADIATKDKAKEDQDEKDRVAKEKADNLKNRKSETVDDISLLINALNIEQSVVKAVSLRIFTAIKEGDFRHVTFGKIT